MLTYKAGMWQCMDRYFYTQEEAKQYHEEYYLALKHMEDIVPDTRKRAKKVEIYSNKHLEANKKHFNKEYNTLCKKYNITHEIEYIDYETTQLTLVIFDASILFQEYDK